METPPPTSSPPDRTKLRILFWIAAAAQAVAVVLELRDGDYLNAAGGTALVAALLLLATARDGSRARKIAIYTLLAVAIGLLVARVYRGS